jgi:plastocyanin
MACFHQDHIWSLDFMRSSSFIVLPLLWLFIAPLDSAAGSFTGRVNFKGTKPAPVKIDMSADKKCLKIVPGKDLYSEQVVVNANNTLKNVFVYVKGGLAKKTYDPPASAVKLDQKGCTYTPHVLGVMVGQQIEINNSDETLHNVHALPKNSKQFNLPFPKRGLKRTESFASPEFMVKVRCDVHNWMSAYIGVLDHPFYSVTDDQGRFSIPNLPPGRYEVEAWHEKYGATTSTVTVDASGSATADFTFGGK